MQDTIRNFVLFVVSSFEILLGYLFLYSTVIRKDEIKILGKLLVTANIIIGGYILMINRNIAFFSQPIFLLFSVVFILIVIGLQKKIYLIDLLLVVTYNASIALIDFFFAFLCMEIVGAEFSNNIYLYSNSWWNIGIYLGTRLLMFILYRVIRKQKIEIREFEKLIAVICIILLLLVRYYLYCISAMSLGERPLDGLGMSASLLVMSIIITIFSALCMKQQILKKENEFLLIRDEMFAQKYLEIQKEMEQNRILIHDIKHDYIVLKNYVQNKEIDKINGYLDTLGEFFEEQKEKIWTGIEIWDMVLQQKKQEAEMKNIDIIINSAILKSVPFNEREGCVLIGNLFDNAIEACENVEREKRRIEINIEMNHQLLFIEFTNSVKDNCYKGISGTTKKDKNMHGYGIKSIKRIVEKYEGALAYHKKDNYFTIRVSFFDIE